MAAQAILAFGIHVLLDGGAILFAKFVGIGETGICIQASSMLLGGRCHSSGNTVTFYLRNGYSQCTQFLYRVHELAITFYPAVLEFEGMDVVVLAIALRIPGTSALPRPSHSTQKWFGSSVSKIRTLCHSQSGKQRSSHSASRLRLSWPRKTRGSPLSVVQLPAQPSSTNRLCRCNRSAPSWPCSAPPWRDSGAADARCRGSFPLTVTCAASERALQVCRRNFSLAASVIRWRAGVRRSVRERYSLGALFIRRVKFRVTYVRLSFPIFERQ